MPHRIIALVFFVTFLVGLSFAQETVVPPAANAQTTTSVDGATVSQTGTSTTTTNVAASAFRDSNETRQQLREVLQKYPPQVARVLKLDPSLLRNPSYLGSYPALQVFVAEHPEIAHSPSYYFENIYLHTELPPDAPNIRIWRDMMEGISIFTVMLLVVGAAIWLVRTVIEHRRWSRMTRTQSEVHNKLMDRFTSSEELLAYMQTPGGKRFLETGAIAPDLAPQRAVSAPIGRILWSVQIGVIIAAVGLGVQLVSRMIDPTVAQPMLAVGLLALSLGVGFLFSAVVSYVLSRRLGLIAAETNASVAGE